MNSGALLLLGLLFGMQHATEADHLAAVATLVTRERHLGAAVRQGVFWGLGHTLTLFAFGGAVLVIGIALSDRWVHGVEGAVGVMLVLLGADVLRRMWREKVHFHTHTHHEHRRVPLRALLVGMVHGMAGSAALVLLTLEQIRSPWTGLVYVLLFGLGSLVGMAALSAVVSLPMRLSAERLTRWHQAMNVVVALFSAGLGFHVIGAQWLS